MATREEYEALYNEGKELEEKEEGSTPTDFYDLLGRAITEAKEERGKLEILFDHPTQVFIRTYRGASGYTFHGSTNYQLLHEYTHYL